MKILLVAAFLFSGAMSAPLEDTPEVKEAKAIFNAAYDDATAGKHADLSPAPVVTSYLADSEEVAQAKKEFDVLFKKAETAAKVSSEAAEHHPIVPIAYPYYTYPMIHSAKGFAYSTVSPHPGVAPLYHHAYSVPVTYHHPSYFYYPYVNYVSHNTLAMEESN